MLPWDDTIPVLHTLNTYTATKSSCRVPLLQEMYFRNLYALPQQPSMEARCESWHNYTALFGVILHGNVNMQLPNGWLWDIIDEFV